MSRRPHAGAPPPAQRLRRGPPPALVRLGAPALHRHARSVELAVTLTSSAFVAYLATDDPSRFVLDELAQLHLGVVTARAGAGIDG